ncbi:hypothetical protein T484DRAFT_1820193 [Baffinella frigidus]|nr:hypothetical protein T484DRAFT_1820193 [Cryptophyta sp. CCMP2293]
MGRLGRKRSSPPARNMRDSLHNRFQIPEEEVLMEEFSCALQEDARLLQGRIFVFNNFVCFSCSLLGSERALRLAFSDIDAIERQDSAYLENTIQALGLVVIVDERPLLLTEGAFDVPRQALG